MLRGKARPFWDRMIRGAVMAVLLLGTGIGCGSAEKPAGEAPAPSPPRDVPVTHGVQNRPPQPDGEARSPSRPVLSDMLNAFLRDRVFWTKNAGVRIEAPAQRPFDPVRFIWFNPQRISPAHRYGADLVLVTDRSHEHYSPGDIEKLNDGNTFLVAPMGVHYNHLSGGRLIEMMPRQSVALHGVRIETTASAAPRIRNQDKGKHHIGFIVFLDLDGDGTVDLNVWYTGPLQADETLAREIMRYPVDVLITRVNAPSALSANDILGLARGVQAKVIVPIGHESSADPVIAELLRSSTIPLWIPPSPDAIASAPAVTN